MPRLSIPQPLKIAVSLLVVTISSGCGRVEWNDDLEYPARTSPLVQMEKHPDQGPPGFPPPGKAPVVPEWLIARGVSVLDPASLANHEWSARWLSSLKEETTRHFGSPGKPRTGSVDTPQLASLANDLGFSETKLAEGARLYRRLCVQCHGISGDGVGAASFWLSPAPRDLRSGDFKFISTAEHKLPTGFQPLKARPRNEDLVKTLKGGLEGTSMPSFALLGDSSLESLAAYVIHLSLRGELEQTVLLGALRQDRETIQAIAKNPAQEELARYKRMLATTLEWEDPDADVDDFVAKQSSPSIPAFAEKFLDRVMREYAAANKNPIVVPAYPYPGNLPTPASSVIAGHTIFKAQCVNCHADYGRQSDLRFEIWGSVVRPANLTISQYKGGRRPIDLYHRIARGIPPCAMPKANLGDSDPAKAGWDLVNFLLALPHPDQIPEEIRQQIYGPSSQPKAGAKE